MIQLCHPQKSFYDILRNKNSKMADQLDYIKDRGIMEWVPLLQFDHGSHAGYPHLYNVERNADKMIPDNMKEQFSEGEIFILLTSIFLHDIGRIKFKDMTNPINPELKDILKEKGYTIHGRKLNQMKKYVDENELNIDQRILFYQYALVQNIITSQERKNFDNIFELSELLNSQINPSNDDHHIKSSEIIKDCWPHLGLPNDFIAHCCGTIAKYHCCNDPDPDVDNEFDSIWTFASESIEPYGRIRVPLLSAILRICDEVDNCYTRTLQKKYREIFLLENDNLYKAFRRLISDVEFCPDGHCIILHLPEDIDDPSVPQLHMLNKQDQHILNSQIRKINTILMNWSSVLNYYDIKYTRSFFVYGNHLLNKIKLTDNRIKLFNLFNAFQLPLYITRDRDKLKSQFKKGEEYTKSIHDEIKDLLNAFLSLSLRTMGYNHFHWKSIEARVGKPLTEKHKWLVRRINLASKYLDIFFHEGDKITIRLQNIPDIKNEVYIELGIKNGNSDD